MVQSHFSISACLRHQRYEHGKMWQCEDMTIYEHMKFGNMHKWWSETSENMNVWEYTNRRYGHISEPFLKDGEMIILNSARIESPQCEVRGCLQLLACRENDPDVFANRNRPPSSKMQRRAKIIHRYPSESYYLNSNNTHLKSRIKLGMGIVRSPGKAILIIVKFFWTWAFPTNGNYPPTTPRLDTRGPKAPGTWTWELCGSCWFHSLINSRHWHLSCNPEDPNSCTQCPHFIPREALSRKLLARVCNQCCNYA